LPLFLRILYKEKNPEVSIDDADIGFSTCLPPAHEERYFFSLANEAIGDIILEQGKEMSNKIIDGRFLSGRDRHFFFQIEEVGIILVY
jgi:hypothetical protein